MVVHNSSPFAARSRVQTLLVMFAGLLGVTAVGEIDSRTGPELALSVIYLLPVGISASLGGRLVGLFVAFFAALFWTFYDINEGRPYQNQLMPYWNGAVRFLIFAIMAVLLDIVRRLTDGLQDLVNQRTAALKTEIHNR